MNRLLLLLAGVAALQSCAGTASLPFSAGVGPDPQLPPAHRETIPTVKVAPAKGWTGSAHPEPAPGLAVTPFATGLVHPRWLAVLPNGDVLVAETNAPPRPADGQGLKGKAMKFFMKSAGAGVPSADRVSLLRDVDGDGVAEVKTAFLEHVPSPFGMALVGNSLYVATADSVLRYPYTAGAMRIDAPATKVADLPGGPINHHWTKNLIASRDGSKLYVSVGSNSNVAENGIEAEEGRASIWEIDIASGRKRLYASGLRNPVGLGWEPSSGALWVVVNERDELGSDLVPDFLTSVRDQAFYGWPYSYFGAHVDERVKPQRPDLVAKAVKPDYALGTHVAPLGLAFSEGATLGSPFASGAFVGEHGSWNRDPRSGYEVVFVPFAGGKPSGTPVPVLGGFLNAAGEAQGRPVGVAIDKRGGLLVADDVGNTVWRVRAQ